MKKDTSTKRDKQFLPRDPRQHVVILKARYLDLNGVLRKHSKDTEQER